MEQNTIDTMLIIQSLLQGFNATDRKDYVLRRSLLTDNVTIDFGEVKAPQVVKADDLMEWAKVAYRDMVTMHMSFNHEVNIEGDKANTYSYGRALHKKRVSKGEDFWFIYAKYEHELIRMEAGWKVSRIKMTPVFQEGNTNLVNQSYEDEVNKKDGD